MRKPHALFLVSVCSVLLPLAPAGARACGSGSSTITNMPTLGDSDFQIYGLNQTGQITGFSYTSGHVAAHAFRYSDGVTTDLGTLGGTFSQGFAINGSGQVAGEANTAGDAQTHATLWTGTNAADLGTLGGSFSTAADLNDAGQVVGTSLTAGDAANHGFLYSGGSIHDLGSLGGGASEAAAINQSGVVVGHALTAAFDDHAFIYTNGMMMDLGTLGGNYSAAFAVNNSGVIAGESDLTNSQTRGFVYAGGSMQNVGTLGGTYSTAFAVNSAGQAIGMATTVSNAHTHGFVYASGTLTDLGTLGGDDTVPYAINNLGQVVGYSVDAATNTHAFLWQSGTMVDLNSLLPTNSGWELIVAQFINDSHRIAGIGIYQGNSLPFVMDLGSANHAPVAAAGADQTVQCGTPVTLDASGSSDPDGDALTYEWRLGAMVLGTNVTLSGTFALGTNVVTLTVTDPCGASSQDTVVVTVVDTTPPSVTCPGAMTASSGANCQAAVPNVLGQVVATDNCAAPGSIALSQSPVAGTLVGLGPHTITVTATDPSGNSATCGTLFTVVDTTAPVFQSLSVSPNVLSPANNKPVAVTVSASVSDNCDGAPFTRITSITSNETTAPGDIQITGNLTANLVASRNPMGTGRIYTITVQSTDASGNTSSGTVTVTVPKNKH